MYVLDMLSIKAILISCIKIRRGSRYCYEIINIITNESSTNISQLKKSISGKKAINLTNIQLSPNGKIQGKGIGLDNIKALSTENLKNWSSF